MHGRSASVSSDNDYLADGEERLEMTDSQFELDNDDIRVKNTVKSGFKFSREIYHPYEDNLRQGQLKRQIKRDIKQSQRWKRNQCKII